MAQPAVRRQEWRRGTLRACATSICRMPTSSARRDRRNRLSYRIMWDASDMRLQGLWRDPDFLKLWAGQTVSQVGSWITLVGLPLTAVLLLGASPLQMGILSGASAAAILLFGLFAGAWADRLRRRPILIWADLGRAAVLVTIPVAVVFHRLTMSHLYLVAAASAILTVFFDVSYQAYLPSLIGAENILEGNSKMTLTESIAGVVGPALTGALIAGDHGARWRFCSMPSRSWCPRFRCGSSESRRRGRNRVWRRTSDTKSWRACKRHGAIPSCACYCCALPPLRLLGLRRQPVYSLCHTRTQTGGYAARRGHRGGRSQFRIWRSGSGASGPPHSASATRSSVCFVDRSGRRIAASGTRAGGRVREPFSR